MKIQREENNAVTQAMNMMNSFTALNHCLIFISFHISHAVSQKGPDQVVNLYHYPEHWEHHLQIVLIETP